MPEHQQTQKPGKPDSTFQKQAALTSQTQVSHPASIIQRARIDPKSLTTADVLQLQRTIGNRAVGRLLSEIRNPSKVQQVPIQRQEVPEEEKEPLQGMFGKEPEEETCPSCVQRQEKPKEEEPLQGKFETIQRLEPEEEEKLQMKPIVQRQEISEEEPLQGKMTEPVQRQEIPEEKEPLQGKMIETVQRQEISEEEPLQKKSENNTGMPDNLKAGVENLSGIDMSDVKVHYNSDKPAKVGALAYTQGTNIHVSPGQERHLPHEAWHVVQQKQGRVMPTIQLKGGEVPINDDEGLEHEADSMGLKAFATEHVKECEKKNIKNEEIFKNSSNVVQRKFDFKITSKGLEIERGSDISSFYGYMGTKGTYRHMTPRSNRCTKIKSLLLDTLSKDVTNSKAVEDAKKYLSDMEGRVDAIEHLTEDKGDQFYGSSDLNNKISNKCFDSKVFDSIISLNKDPSKISEDLYYFDVKALVRYCYYEDKFDINKTLDDKIMIGCLTDEIKHLKINEKNPKKKKLDDALKIMQGVIDEVKKAKDDDTFTKKAKKQDQQIKDLLDTTKIFSKPSVKGKKHEPTFTMELLKEGILSDKNIEDCKTRHKKEPTKSKSTIVKDVLDAQKPPTSPPAKKKK